MNRPIGGFFGGGGSVPINSFIDLYEFESVVVRDGATYFRTGYVDTNVSAYPDASKMSWLYPATDGTGQGGWSQVSSWEYRFNRWICAMSNSSSTGTFSFVSSADFVSFSTGGGASLTVQATQSPVLAWNGSNNTLYCYVGTHSSRFKTTDGINWTTDSITGLTGHIMDVVLFGSLWVALTTTGIWSSTDGLTWTQRLVWAAGASTDAGKIAIDGSGNIIAVQNGKSVYYTSSNGTSWVSQNCPADHTAAGWLAFGDGKLQATFRNVLTTGIVSGTATSLTNWVLGATTGFAGRYHNALGVWVGAPIGFAATNQAYSKDGKDWIQVGGSVTTIGGWVVVGSKTYGSRLIGGSNFSPASCSHLVNVVGLPYSLSSLAIGSNKFLRVK